MAVQGGAIEQKEIGLPINNEGTFNNTVVVDDTIQISKKSNGLLNSDGTWTSRTIDIGDKFREFGKLLTSDSSTGNGKVEVSTRTSADSVTYEEWRAVSSEGDILSTKNRYIQVRLKLIADVGQLTEEITIEKINDNNEFTEIVDGNLQLKREFEFDMIVDDSWTGEGKIHRKLIRRDDWTRIDKLNVLLKEVN